MYKHNVRLHLKVKLYLTEAVYAATVVGVISFVYTVEYYCHGMRIITDIIQIELVFIFLYIP